MKGLHFQLSKMNLGNVMRVSPTKLFPQLFDGFSQFKI